MGHITAQLLFLWQLVKDILFVKDKIEFSDHPSQTNKTWIVTGSTAGIGLNVAAKLASLGAKVWLVGRNQEKTLDVIETIKTQFPGAQVDYLIMDFADLSSIKHCVEKFNASGDSLNGIVTMPVTWPPGSTRPRMDMTSTSRSTILPPWLLQKLLDPVFLKSSDTVEGRIVWVSSLTLWASTFSEFELALDPSNCGVEREPYFVSKAVNLKQSIKRSVLNPGANVKSLSVHPGVKCTALNDAVNEMSAGEQWLMNKIMWDPIYGLYAELAAAPGPFEIKAYIVPSGKVGTARSDIVAVGRDLNLSKWLDAQIAKFFKLNLRPNI